MMSKLSEDITQKIHLAVTDVFKQYLG
jgi:hypothetical protein